MVVAILESCLLLALPTTPWGYPSSHLSKSILIPALSLGSCHNLPLQWPQNDGMIDGILCPEAVTRPRMTPANIGLDMVIAYDAKHASERIHSALPTALSPSGSVKVTQVPHVLHLIF